MTAELPEDANFDDNDDTGELAQIPQGMQWLFDELRQYVKGTQRQSETGSDEALNAARNRTARKHLADNNVAAFNAFRCAYPDFLPQLAGVNLEGKTVEGADFSGLDLRGLVVDDVVFVACSFKGAQMEGFTYSPLTFFGPGCLFPDNFVLTSWAEEVE